MHGDRHGRAMRVDDAHGEDWETATKNPEGRTNVRVPVIRSKRLQRRDRVRNRHRGVESVFAGSTTDTHTFALV